MSTFESHKSLHLAELIDPYNLAFDSFQRYYSYTTPKGIKMKFCTGEVCHSLETLAERWVGRKRR